MKSIGENKLKIVSSHDHYEINGLRYFNWTTKEIRKSVLTEVQFIFLSYGAIDDRTNQIVQASPCLKFWLVLCRGVLYGVALVKVKPVGSIFSGAITAKNRVNKSESELWGPTVVHAFSKVN